MAKIGHIILNVSNFNIASNFYDKLMLAMNFEVNHFDEGDWGKAKSYVSGEHNLWIRFDENKLAEKFIRNVGLDHLAFRVETKKSVDEIYQILKKENYTITRSPKSYPQYNNNYYAFYFRDPDDIPLEVYFN